MSLRTLGADSLSGEVNSLEGGASVSWKPRASLLPVPSLRYGISPWTKGSWHPAHHRDHSSLGLGSPPL